MSDYATLIRPTALADWERLQSGRMLFKIDPLQ